MELLFVTRTFSPEKVIKEISEMLGLNINRIAIKTYDMQMTPC